jgi:hypothetical protein
MKITKLFILALAVVFLACKDDEDPLPTAAGLLGDWSLTALTYEGSTTTTVAGISITSEFVGVGKDFDLTVLFEENPNTVLSVGSYTIELTTTIAGVSETENITFTDFIQDGTWTLNGKTLTVTSSGETEEATIISQTSTTMILEVKLEETETIPGVGSVAINLQGVYTLTKL